MSASKDGLDEKWLAKLRAMSSHVWVVRYSYGAYEDARTDAVMVVVNQSQRSLEKHLKRADVIVSDAYDKYSELCSEYHAGATALDHDGYLAKQKRAMLPFRKKLKPLIGDFAKVIDLSENGRFWQEPVRVYHNLMSL